MNSLRVGLRHCIGRCASPVRNSGVVMLSLNVVPREDRPLTDQIVMGVRRQIDDRQLRPGTRLPSIRNFAETHGVSRFTVVEAYDRLVAMGCLQSRRGAGFYTASALAPAEATHPAPSDHLMRNEG